jgi:hypothetical protein
MLYVRLVRRVKRHHDFNNLLIGIAKYPENVSKHTDSRAYCDIRSLLSYMSRCLDILGWQKILLRGDSTSTPARMVFDWQE